MNTTAGDATTEVTHSGRRSRNRRGEGALLRAEILEAATSLLEQTGEEEAVTLRAVARAAGITAPSIYPHFADRDAILRAVIIQTFDELAACLRPASRVGSDPVTRLHSGCQAYLDFAGQHPTRYRVLFQRHRSPDVEITGVTDITQIQTMPGADALGVLIEAVAACIEAGLSRAATPFDAAARVWVGMHGIITLRASLPWFPWGDPNLQLHDMLSRTADLVPANPT